TSTTGTVKSSLNPSTYGQSVTFTAAVTGPGSAAPSGTVTFYNGATSIGTGTLSSGTASLTTSSLGVGTQSITATYGGDGNYSSSSSSTALSQVVNKASTKMTDPSASGAYCETTIYGLNNNGFRS
ncbi:MAG: Ig-like domain-containing protein, partial [Syntrophobacteraceae bacterium]